MVKKTDELWLAAVDGKLDLIGGLLDSGVPVDEADDSGKSPLMFAAAYGHLDALDLLIRRGANPNLRAQGDKRRRQASLEEWEARVLTEDVPLELGQTPLTWALTTRLQSESVHAQVLQKLLAAGADPDLPNVRRQTPLMLAVKWGRAEIARLLLEAGADPNARDVYGYSALMHARRSLVPGEGVGAATDLLRSFGADDRGLIELDLLEAARKADLEGVRAALEKGADVGFLDDSGNTALCHAVDARSENPHAAFRGMEILLERGLSPNRVSPRGKPALFDAIEEGDLEVVQLLLRYGADPSLTWYGDTALDYAKGCRKREILNVLKEAGAPKRDWSKERGLPARDGEMAAVLVKQVIEKVSAALAEGGEVLRGIQGQEVTCGKGSLLVYQLVGHPWTVIETAADDFLGPELAADLSRSLGAAAVWIGASDTAGAFGYDLFEAGERTEWFYDGPGRKGNEGWERDFGSREKKRKPSKNAEPQEILHRFLRAQEAFYMGPQLGVADQSQTFFSGWGEQELVRADLIKVRRSARQ